MTPPTPARPQVRPTVKRRGFRLAAALACVAVACAPASPAAPEASGGATREPPPARPSATADWRYGMYLLAVVGDPATADEYLERVALEGGIQGVAEPSLFYRDLAEARLFAGDVSGAGAAARSGRAELDKRPTSAQFQPDDRSLFERDLAALEAAGASDIEQLDQLARTSPGPPAADPWYLLGWVEERSGDASGAQAAYREYLQLAPAWSFLRQAPWMIRHARAVTAA